MKKRQQYKKFITLGLLVILIVLIIYFYNKYTLLETKTYPVKFNITNETWFFNVKEATLDFGAVLKPNKMWRKMNFTNDKDYPVTIHYEVTGTATPYVYVEPIIIIPPKTTQLINVTIITTKDSPIGHYEGELIMKIHRGKK